MMFSSLRGRLRTSLGSGKMLPGLAISSSVLLYALHFFVGGGQARLIKDSYNYLSMSQGELPGTPFNTRIVGPLMARVIADIAGTSHHTAFQILTFLSIVATLLVLRKLISEQGGSPEWQAAVLLTLGCGLAATFGYIPVMADPLLLLVACCTLLALHRGQLAFAIGLAALAALTKEYGVLLGLPVSVVAYRRGRRSVALIAAVLPMFSLLCATLQPADSSGIGFQSWGSFTIAMFGYHSSLFKLRGPSEYPKLLYMWSWSVLWPCLAIAFGIVLSRLRNRDKLGDHEISFLVILAALPILLLGDWGRSLLIAVPFGCVVATKHTLSTSNRFAALLAVGGLSTALARPFHSDPLPPKALTLTMIVISAASSILIGIKVLRLSPSGSSESFQQGLDNPTSEAVAR
jgi:hypothetical protein